MTKYDFSKSSEWMPLFGKPVPAPIFNQKITINYFETFDVSYIQEKIEKKIRQKIMKWRKQNVTIWNHYCSSVLKEVLPKLEINYLYGNLKNGKNFEEMHGLFNSYKVAKYDCIFL